MTADKAGDAGSPRQAYYTVTLRVSGEQHDRWRARAYRERKAMSAFVRNAVEVYLKAVQIKEAGRQ